MPDYRSRNGPRACRFEYVVGVYDGVNNRVDYCDAIIIEDMPCYRGGVFITVSNNEFLYDLCGFRIINIPYSRGRKWLANNLFVCSARKLATWAFFKKMDSLAEASMLCCCNATCSTCVYGIIQFACYLP